MGARNVKAVQLKQVRGGWRVDAAAMFPRPGPSDRVDRSTARQLGDVLYRQGFQGHDIVLATPGQRLLTSMLELPADGPNVPNRQIARAEMARLHKLDAQSFELACWTLPAPDRAGKTSHVMATACSHDDADSLLDTFEDHGLSVRALDIGACALARANAPELRDTGRIVAILDLGWSATNLVVMHGDVITYQRTLVEAGLESLHNGLASQFGGDADVAEHVLRNVGLAAPQEAEARGLATDADVRRVMAKHFEAMLNELLASLSYMSRQYADAAINSLLLVGAGAAVPGLAEYLETMLSAPVKTMSPADLVDCRPTLLETCRNPAMTLAMGLALFSDRG